MKSITIHNFDDDLAKSLLVYAKLQGTSMNQTIKGLLKKSLGLDNQKKKEDFSDLCGVLDEKEAKLIERALEDFEKIDEEDWK